MSKARRYIFMLLMAGALLALALLLYLGWTRQESAPSGGTKFVSAEEAGHV